MTPAELAAARAFRDAMRAELAKVAASFTVSVYVRQYRHDCAAKGGKSTALELREHYVFSPAYDLAPGPDGDIVTELTEAGARWSQENDEWAVIVPAKRFGWIFTRGRCPACKLAAVSKTGRLVDPDVRPPEHAIVIS